MAGSHRKINRVNSPDFEYVDDISVPKAPTICSIQIEIGNIIASRFKMLHQHPPLLQYSTIIHPGKKGSIFRNNNDFEYIKTQIQKTFKIKFRSNEFDRCRDIRWAIDLTKLVIKEQRGEDVLMDLS